MKCIMDRLMVSMSMTQYDYTISTPKDKLQFLYTNFHFSQSSNWILFYFLFLYILTFSIVSIKYFHKKPLFFPSSLH